MASPNNEILNPVENILEVSAENSVSIEDETPVPVETETPLPVETETPLPVETGTPLPVETKTPVPVEAETSVPVEEKTPVLIEAENSSLVEAESSLSTETENTSPANSVNVLEGEESLQSKTDNSVCSDETEIKVSSEKSDAQTEQEENNSADEDFEDIDLTAIELAQNIIETIESPEMASSMKMSDTYENIMNACSSTAQAIKKTISDVLKSRENIVITAGDTTAELEASLSQKIADFENVVGGCFLDETDSKTDLTNIKHPAFSNVIITEVNESEESNLSSSSKTESLAEKKPSVDSSVPSISESIEDSKNLQKTEKASVTNKDSASNFNKKNSKEAKNTKMQQVQAESVQVVSCPEEDKNFKKQQKSNSNKKKGEKTVDQILKSLSNYSTTEQKLQVLCKKHLEALEELRLFDPRIKQLERQVMAQQREKEQLQAEHNRNILAKSRLESLCRELQRQNKAVKEESLMHIKAEEERRKEVANKFQVTLSDISALMQEHSVKNIQLREENAELAKKLKALVDHYDMWEKHMEKVMHQNHLETQLAKAKHAKVNLLLKQETEKFLREKQSLLENMTELQKKCALLASNELKLRTELGDYTSKYEEFQTVLNKSSQVFANFKNDMEATSKKIKKLEKETNVYKQKWESSNNALLGMINDKQKHDKELANAHQRILTLEKLCRALQAERNDLQNQLNGSIESSKKDVPSQPAETPVA